MPRSADEGIMLGTPKEDQQSVVRQLRPKKLGAIRTFRMHRSVEETKPAVNDAAVVHCNKNAMQCNAVQYSINDIVHSTNLK